MSPGTTRETCIGVSPIRSAPAASRSTELQLLLALLIFLLLGGLFQPQSGNNLIISSFNIISSFLFVIILIFGMRAELRREPMAIWTALIWFRIASLVYHGIGSLIPYFSNEYTVISMKSLFYFDDSDVVKVNTIDVLCVLTVLTSAKVFESRLKIYQMVRRSPSSLSLPILAVAFLLVGGVVRYGVVVPHLFGFGDGFLPAPLAMATKIYSAGLMLLLIFTLRSQPQLMPVTVVLIAIELIVGVLLFSKSDVISTIIFVTLALYQNKPSTKRLIFSAVFAFTLFSQINPLVAYGRSRAIEIGGQQQTASLSQRIEIVESFLYGDRFPGLETDEQAALSRLSYVPAQAMVVSWYDHGISSSSLGDIFIVLIPRILWPGKPDVTTSGRDLYTAATGNIGTSISPGLFAESYSNMGWLGIPVLMIPVGFMLTILSQISTAIMRHENFFYLPVVLVGVQVGTRVDGHFVLDVVGGPVTVLLLFAALRVLEPVLIPKAAGRI